MVRISRPDGDEFQINTFTEGNQEHASIAALSDGGIIVTWMSEGQDGSGMGIYGQRYAADGTPEGAEFQANTYTLDHQATPCTIGFDDGSFLVTWQSNNRESGGVSIYGQYFASDGTPLGDEFGITTHSPGDHFSPAATPLSDGGFVVVTAFNNSDNVSVTGQIFDAEGNAVGGQFGVNSYNYGNQNAPAVTSLSDGGFVVTWTSPSYDQSGIYGQRYDASGTRIGSEFQINTVTAGHQDQSAVAALNDHGFVVTWMSHGQDGAGYGIYGQRFDETGKAEGEEFQVNTFIIGAQASPSLTALEDGGFVVVWVSEEQDGEGQGIFGQHFNSNGSKYGNEFQINSHTISSQSYPTVAALGENSFVVTWESDAQDGSGTGIFAQRFVTNGLPTGEAVIIGTASQGQTLSVDINSVNDPDGIDIDTISYQWLRDGFLIEGATDSTHLLRQADVSTNLTVQLSYLDRNGVLETLSSDPTTAVQNINDGPDGAVVIEGLLRLREVITADTSAISDPDGLGLFSYQWVRGTVAIAGATGVTYTVQGDDIGENLNVAISYTDDFGHDEEVVSAAVVPEANAPGVTLKVVDSETGEDGDTASFSIKLESEIQHGVEIIFRISDTTEAMLTTATVVFTKENWDAIQLVTITGIDDFDDDGDIPFEVTGALATDDPNYKLKSVETLSFLNVDDTDDTNIQLYGSNEVDILRGLNGDDRLYGLGNLDDLYGGRGNDRLYGGYGNDQLYGELGNDELYGEQDDDHLEGGAGNDELYGGGSSDLLWGGEGDDILNGGTGVDNMIGGAGNDTYYVDRAEDVIEDYGLASDEDTVIVIGDFTYKLGNGLENANLSTESGPASLAGNRLDNTLIGNNSANTLQGNGGNDTLYSAGGRDTVLGGNGNDMIIGGNGAGNDSYKGGRGVDTVKYTSASAGIEIDLSLETAKSIGPGNAAGIGRDVLSGIENIIAGKFDDLVTGDRAANRIQGGKGNDSVNGGKGNDHLLGGDGVDEIRGATGSDSLIGGNDGDALFGGSGKDTMFGGGGDDVLMGGKGNDYLKGGKGNDRLAGGANSDRLSGGSGEDHFVFRNGNGRNQVTDFEDGSDRIEIKSGAHDLTEVQIFAREDDAVIKFSDVIVVLLNFDHTLLDASDFTF